MSRTGIICHSLNRIATMASLQPFCSDLFFQMSFATSSNLCISTRDVGILLSGWFGYYHSLCIREKKNPHFLIESVSWDHTPRKRDCRKTLLFEVAFHHVPTSPSPQRRLPTLCLTWFVSCLWASVPDLSEMGPLTQFPCSPYEN